MEALLVLLYFAAALAAIVLIGTWILGPVDRAARNRRYRVQFTMADCLALVFLCQFPMGAVSALQTRRDITVAFLAVLCGWGICGAIWWTSVRSLSQAGVWRTWQRSLFLMVVAPLGYVGSVVTVVISFLLVVTLFEPLALAGRRWLLPWFVAADIALLAAFYVAGRFTRRLVAETASDVADGSLDR